MEKTTFTVLSCILKPTHASALKLKEGRCEKELATNATDDFMKSTTTAARIAILFAIAIVFHTAVLAQGNNYEGPVGVTGIFNGNVTTGCSYDPLTQSAHRVIDDIVVPGSIGKYPLKMTRYYNSRQQMCSGGPAIGLSPGWAHKYRGFYGVPATGWSRLMAASLMITAGRRLAYLRVGKARIRELRLSGGWRTVVGSCLGMVMSLLPTLTG